MSHFVLWDNFIKCQARWKLSPAKYEDSFSRSPLIKVCQGTMDLETGSLKCNCFLFLTVEASWL